MKIITNFKKNIIPTQYSKGAGEEHKLAGNPILSFPFRIEGLPKDTKAVVWTLIDYDAVPVCGFAWIHWIAYQNDINGSIEIEANASRKNKTIVQGKNSFATGLIDTDFSEIENNYVGPTPPDQDHIYTLSVYALNQTIELPAGFYYNALLKSIKKYVIDSTEIELIGLKYLK